MRIGELSSRTSVSVRSLRYYEEKSLLPAVRSPSGQRLYPEQSVERVNLIQQLFMAGLSSRTILELLPCVEAADGGDAEHSHDVLSTERDRIEAQIRALERARDTLDTVINATRACATAATPTRSPSKEKEAATQ